MGCEVNLGWKIGHGTEKVENHYSYGISFHARRSERFNYAEQKVVE